MGMVSLGEYLHRRHHAADISRSSRIRRVGDRPGTFGNSPAAARQVRELVRSAYFAARALKVETDADGSKWVTVQFAADAEGSKFISAACATGPLPDGDALWLEEPGKPLVRCYHFMGPASVSGGPYDIVIPIIYAKTVEEDRPVQKTAQVLSFFGIE